MTLSVPDELLVKMREHSEIKWSEVARRTFVREVEMLEVMDKLLDKSRLSEGDAERIGSRVKAEIRKRFK